VYTVFALYSPSYTLSLQPPSLCPQDLFYLPVFWFCRRKKWHFVCLR
jgi:hypothetical protein